MLQLDLYNQRLLEKREQEFKEMLARKKQGETSKDGLLISSGIRTSVFKIRYFILTRNLSLAGI